MPFLRQLLLILLLTCYARAQMTWSLAGGYESWPADKRADIISAMDAAVALYNANGYFEKNLTAKYNAAVTTAQANYDGWIEFGGSISTRVALHEISHTLGVGVYWNWDPKISSGKWTGTFALNRVKLFDGASATVGCDTNHFWPYGLNYDNEDSTTNRVRHIKMVSALRRDMGIVTDSDGDGIPNDWEMFYFGDLNQTATGDADADGTNNLTEYNADTNPATNTFQWTGAASSDWPTAGNWSSAPAPSNGTYYVRLNVNNNANNPLVHDASRGTTVFRPKERGLVIGSGANNANTTGTMIVTGGSFSTVGADGPDVIGNGLGNTGSLTLDGGSFASSELQLGVTGQGTGTLTLNSGSATITTLAYRFGSGGTGTVHLNASTLTTGGIVRSGTGSATLNLNGGTLRAASSSTAFLENLTNTFIKAGGVTIDTSTHAITIAQPLKNDASSPGGGLTKSGTGSLVLTGTNTYTGPTSIGAGIVVAGNPAATSGSASVAADATLALTGGLAYSETQSVTVSGTGQKSATTLTPAVQRGALQSLTGNNTWNGPVTIASSRTRIGVQDGASLILTGPVTEAAPATAPIFRAGANPGDDILISNPSNSWTGPTVAFSSSAIGGALKLGASNALPATSPLYVAGNAVQGRVDLNGNDQTVAGLSNDTGGQSAIGAGIITNTGASPSTLTISPTTTHTFIGTIQDGTQPVHLVKSGPATQILTATQAYSGDTTVNSGTLRIDNPYLSNQSAVAIAINAKLHLNFTGTDTIQTLTLGGIPMSPGTYSAATHPAFLSGTGSLTATSGPAPGYEAWAATWQITEDSTGDPDSDGLTNLAEYALGLDPKSPNPSPGTLVGNLLTFHKGSQAVAAGDLTYSLETSLTLAPGSWSPVTPDTSDDSSITFTLPPGHDQIFTRLKVTR